MGVYTYKNGNIYKGEFNKIFSMEKELILIKIGIYEGDYKNRNEGEFKAGKPVGIYLKYYANGDIKQIEFK